MSLITTGVEGSNVRFLLSLDVRNLVVVMIMKERFQDL